MSSTDIDMDVSERFANDLHDIGVVKSGSFKLKTGMIAPVYFDFRVVISHPAILSRLALEIAHRIETTFGRSSFDVICGVPYTALPFSVLAAQHLDAPLLVKRKEAKTYGTMSLIDGKFKPGDRCIIIEDTVTSGTSIVEVVQSLEAAGLRVVGAVALLDREQGGASNLEMAGIPSTFIFKASSLLYALQQTGKLNAESANKAVEFLRSNRVPLTPTSKPPVGDKENDKRSVTNGAKLVPEVTNPIPIGSRLFQIMQLKKSNLCIAADVATCQQLVDLADVLGPYICAFKTHVDALNDDFNEKTEKQLATLAQKHNFLLIEDRKLADIGNTSKRIFTRLCRWADLVTVHGLPGVDQIRAMAIAPSVKPCGVLLITEMSCAGNLITSDYTKACIDMACQFPDFVIGAISQNGTTLSDLKKQRGNTSFAILTPGISLSAKGDAVGQCYSTPDKAIRERGTDIIIVGRGILDEYNGESSSFSAVIAAAEKYKAAAWSCYQECHFEGMNK